MALLFLCLAAIVLTTSIDLAIGNEVTANPAQKRCEAKCLAKRKDSPYINYPVCALDGKTYKNECVPMCQGVVNKI